MPEYLAPGVYIEEVDTGNKPIEGVSTSTAGMVGVTERGPVNVPVLVSSRGEFERIFGDVLDHGAFTVNGRSHAYLPHAVDGFFTNGGRRLFVTRVAPDAAEHASRMLFARPDTAAGDTRLLRSAARDTGTLANPPLLYALDTTGINDGDWVRIGDGSRAEYHVVNVSDQTLVAMQVPLDATAAAGHDVVTYHLDTPDQQGMLDADAASGELLVQVDIAAAPPPGAVLVIGSPARQVRRISAVSGGGPFQVEFERPLDQAHHAGPPGDCSQSYGCGTNLSGLFWVYTGTSRGTFLAGTAAGYHVSNDGDTADDGQLANHDIALAPDASFNWSFCPDVVVDELPQAFHWWPIPWERLPPVFDGAEGHAAQLFVLQDVGQKRIALVQEGGGSVDVGAFIKSNLTDVLLTKPYQWVSAVEPSLAMAPAMTLGGPMVLGLDGLDVADAIWQRDGRLGADADEAPVSIGGLAEGPSDYDSPFPVYSRSAQRLYLIGGVDEEGYTGALWMRPIATGAEEAWQEVSLEYTPHEVLAATYSPRDGQVWLLDLDDATVRLVRIHPPTGHHRVMASWERSEKGRVSSQHARDDRDLSGRRGRSSRAW